MNLHLLNKNSFHITLDVIGRLCLRHFSSLSLFLSLLSSNWRHWTQLASLPLKIHASKWNHNLLTKCTVNLNGRTNAVSWSICRQFLGIQSFGNNAMKIVCVCFKPNVSNLWSWNIAENAMVYGVWLWAQFYQIYCSVFQLILFLIKTSKCNSAGF